MDPVRPSLPSPGSANARQARTAPCRLIQTPPLDLVQQVALDAALLQSVNDGAPACWRFWEPCDVGVVLGTGMAVDDDVYLDRLRDDGLSLVRRFSGGGTVLQAPGMLNFTAVLPIHADDNDSQTIRGSYLATLGVVQQVLGGWGLTTDFHAPSDLAIGGRKIAGNAQARKRNAFLVHGCILVRPNISLIDSYLRMPRLQPEYRQGRSHRQFVVSLADIGGPDQPAELQHRLQQHLGLRDAAAPTAAETDLAAELVAEKFACESWTLRK